jgi:uncharacterized protein (TIGR02145 family)
MKKLINLFFIFAFVQIISSQTMNVNKKDGSTESYNLLDIENITFSLGETVTDNDGNTYQTIKIGNQVWMAENLKVTHYRNGNAIPNVTVKSTWLSLTTGAYCNYNNDGSDVATCGRLYNYYAVNDGRKLAPTGWHIPSDTDWQTLVDYLGGATVAGGKMKGTDTTWNSPNIGATNESGFLAVSCSLRQYGDFNEKGNYAHFWSSSLNATIWRLNYRDTNVMLFNTDKHDGISVRCVKD